MTTEKVALAVGEAIIRGLEGDDYVELYKPLRARKILGFWVIDGLSKKAREGTISFEEARLAIDPANGAVVLYGLMPDERMLQLLKLRKPMRFPSPNPSPSKTVALSPPKRSPAKLTQVAYINFKAGTYVPVTTTRIWSDGTDMTRRVRNALPEIDRILRSGKPGGRFLDGLVRLGARTSVEQAVYVDQHGTVLREGKTFTLSKTTFARLGALMPSTFPTFKSRKPRITTGSGFIGAG